jgi:hypothetical protein
MAQISSSGHCAKLLVNLCFTSPDTLCHPADDMVFKYALVKLVEKVWGKAQEDMATRKAFPKRIDRSMAEVIKFL